MRPILAGVCCGLLLMCGGCGNQEDAAKSLYDEATITYEHPDNGAVITLPADWEKLSENDESVVFADKDDTISLTINRELGGFSYYSTEGLLEMAKELADVILPESETITADVLNHPDDAVIYTAVGQMGDFSGNDSDDNSDETAANAVCEVVVISPLSAVRYHVVVISEVDTYVQNEELLREIYASFELNKTEDEIYQSLSLTASRSNTDSQN